VKTNLSKKTFILLTFASIIMGSCGKESNSFLPASGLPDNQPSSASIGSIVDLGIINADTRIMRAHLNAQNYTLYGSNEELSYVLGQVTVAFNVNADGFIPSGKYTFSNSETKSPFTFDSGDFLFADSGDSNGIQSDQIVNGNIIVDQNEDKYVIALQVDLASGMTFSERLNGSLSYADSK
jgi:hypothetical protein